MHFKTPKYNLNPYLILVNTFLVVNILFATTGVALYKHYCFVDQEQNISMFGYNDDCNHEVVELTCCSTENPPKPEAEDKDCCAIDFDYLALKVPVTLKDESASIDNSSIVCYTIVDLNSKHFNYAFNQTDYFKNQTPPQPAGKDIIIAKQAFLA